jgi:hypothetical protein
VGTSEDAAGGTESGYEYVNVPDEPPADHDPDAFKLVALNVPPAPPPSPVAGVDVAANTIALGATAALDSAERVLVEVVCAASVNDADTELLAASFTDDSGVSVRQAGTFGVVKAQAGKRTRRSRAPKSPP